MSLKTPKKGMDARGNRVAKSETQERAVPDALLNALRTARRSYGLNLEARESAKTTSPLQASERVAEAELEREARAAAEASDESAREAILAARQLRPTDWIYSREQHERAARIEAAARAFISVAANPHFDSGARRCDCAACKAFRELRAAAFGEGS